MRLGGWQWAAPFLVALHLPLFLYARNVHAFLLQEVSGASAVAVILAACLVILLYALTRDRARTVCLAAGVVGWCAWYGVFSHAAATYAGAGPLAGGRAATVLVVWTAFWLAYAASALRARSLEVRASSWLLASVVLVAQPLVTLGSFVMYRPDTVGSLPAPVALQRPASLPDVIHLIFDRYASPGILHARYGFDNSPLAEQLRARGFFVAERSHANYFKTGLSLAATLNHTYLNDHFAGLETASDWRPIYRLLRQHRVWQSLRPLGYDYVHMGSWWEPTRHNPYATESRSYTRVPHFAHWLYRNTPLFELGVSFGGLLDARREQWRRVHRQLQDLEGIRTGPRPRFVFVHFLLPHDPYVFSPGGEFLEIDIVRRQTSAQSYVNQVRFANAAMVRLVDRWLADRTRPRPILILQSDEGPYPARYEADTLGFDWRRATRDELREKFGVLNAMYLPDARPRGLHPGISPVNTYRVVFDAYFGTDLGLLPDRSYVSVGDRRPYDFIDVTDALTGNRAGGP